MNTVKVSWRIKNITEKCHYLYIKTFDKKSNVEVIIKCGLSTTYCTINSTHTQNEKNWITMKTKVIHKKDKYVRIFLKQKSNVLDGRGDLRVKKIEHLE